MPLAHRLAGDVGAAESDTATGDRGQPGDRVDKFGLAVPLDAGDADDLALMDGQADPGQAAVLLVVEQADIIKLENRRAGPRAAPPDGKADRPANHHFGKVGFGELRRIAIADDLALAKNADAVGDLENLVKLVGDEDDGLAGVAKRPHDAEEFLDLLRRQNGCRFVKDQHIGRTEQHLQDFHALLDSDRKVPDQGFRRHIHAIAVVDVLDLGARRVQIEIVRAPCRFNAQNDVLDNAEHRDKHEMLMHHADAGLDAVARPVKGRRRAIDQNLAAILAVKTRQDVHQGGFAGTILAKKPKHLASANLQVDILVRPDRAKALADATQLDIHRNSSQKNPLPPDGSGGNGFGFRISRRR